jgi:hypothetical protein
MHISWEWKTEYRASEWTFGFCKSCQRTGPVRIEDAVDVCYLWSILRVAENYRDEQEARCDFCHRRVQSVSVRDGLALHKWSPRDGVDVLLDKLGIEADDVRPAADRDAPLHSLLRFVEKSTALPKTELSPVGMVVRAAAGALVAIPLGMWLYDMDYLRAGPDRFGSVSVCCMLGLVVGLILGAVVETLVRWDRSAVAMIEATHEKYGLDLERLEELAQGYGKHVRKAVARVRAKAARSE